MECAAISSLQRQIAEWALALVLAWLCASARAQSPDPTKAERPAQGVTASATYDGETVSDLSGGAKRGSTYHGSLQLQAAFDFERLFGWADTTGFLYGMGLHGGQPDDFTGGAQGVSSITGPRGARLDEAWLQHNFLGNRLSLLGELRRPQRGGAERRARAASRLERRLSARRPPADAIGHAVRPADRGLPPARRRRRAREPLRVLCRRGARRLGPLSRTAERGRDRNRLRPQRLALQGTAGAARHAGAKIGNRGRAELSRPDLEVGRRAAGSAIHRSSEHGSGDQERARVPASVRGVVLGRSRRITEM